MGLGGESLRAQTLSPPGDPTRAWTEPVGYPAPQEFSATERQVDFSKRRCDVVSTVLEAGRARGPDTQAQQGWGLGVGKGWASASLLLPCTHLGCPVPSHTC